MPTGSGLKDEETLGFKRTLGRRGNTIEGRSSFLLKAVEFNPAQYQTLKQALKTLEYNRRKMPVFAAATAAAPHVVPTEPFRVQLLNNVIRERMPPQVHV